MKHVINWTVGSFFRTLGRIIAYVAIGSIIAFAFTYKPKAATLTSYDTYTKIMNQESGCGTSNRYSYTQYANNDPAGDLWSTGSFNTQYSGKAAILYFNFQYNLTAGKYYDVDINFNTSDLSSSLNTTNVYVDSGTSCQDLSADRVALIGFTLSNTGTNYSNKATIRILANSATTYWGIQLYKGVGQFVTGVNNWRINSLTITEVDPSNTNIVIDNATNNTTNIINNNNENTHNIINNQNELLGRKCENMFNNSNITPNTTFDSSGNTFTANGFFLGNDYIEVQPNTPYALDSYNGYRVVEYTSSKSFIQRLFDVRYFTTGSNTYYIRLSGNTSNLNNVMLVQGSTSKSYCKYGSYSSKLDETNDLLNNDDTSSATNQAGSFFSNFTTNTHGLTSIITAPLAAIQSLTNSTCTPLVLPLPYVNRDLTLPCMREIYVSNFGGFMTLYDTITFGIIAYWVLVRIFALVKDFKNPEHDEIEVMDL